MSTAVQIKEECWGKRSFPSIQQATKWIQERPVKIQGQLQGTTAPILIAGGRKLDAEASGYTRPPPGRIIETAHTKSSSHPQQVHISAVAADHMRVSWITDDRHVPSLVEYGKVSGKYDSAATGEHTSYIYFFYTSGKIHHVKIGPLEPDTVYYYRCGGIDQEFSFKTPPAALPIEIAVIGSMLVLVARSAVLAEDICLQTEWTASTLAHVAESNYDMLLLPGDLSYADTQQPLWDSFGRFVQPYASKRPWMVTEGNHDIEAFPVFHCHPFVAYDSRWRMPYDESGSASNLYYSFDVAGAVHVVMLGSYADFNTSSSQYKWLVADLAKVDRRITPWLVALLHAPWYNTNLAHQGEGESMRQAMESLLYRARVDVVFAGHVHAYERFVSLLLPLS
ncbi:Calcineurin-like phosphoesterase [Musa troglodytarum]|uniref:Purple acid phosphatase n=1 Tax=Musa troglodytarum TaxID=320322 RepID=A0A9E7END5_9LILI|nr:Calcineurin-like phosphoesterase [Musa troglodytarum]